MKVLFLTTRLPTPPWRGDQVRAFHLLAHLARRHEITCATIALSAPAPADIRATEALGVRVTVLPVGPIRAGMTLVRGALGDRRPFQVLLYAQQRTQAFVDALVARERFDLVHAQLVRAASCLPRTSAIPIVLDLIDALSASFARRARHDRWPWRTIAGIEARRLSTAEAAFMTRAAATVVVSDADRAALPEGPDVHVIPNGVDQHAFPRRAHQGVPDRVIFAGNLGYFPNVDAAERIVHDIVPILRRRRPRATIRLVGTRPHRRVRRLASMAGVDLVGEVRDMARELATAQVVLAPMRAGGGIQNKVLEAMAVGVPVVTTPTVAAAFGSAGRSVLRVGDDDETLAGAVADLMDSPEDAAVLSDAAHELIRRSYSWEGAADRIEVLWRSAVRRSS